MLDARKFCLSDGFITFPWQRWFSYLFLIIVLSYLFIGWRCFLPAVIPGHAHCSQEMDSMRKGQGAQETEDTLSNHLKQVQQVIQRELPVHCERHITSLRPKNKCSL